MNVDEREEPKRSRVGLIIVIVPVIVAALMYTQLTFFVVQPIGAAPEGTTIVMLRGQKMQIIDSADAICQRTQGGVSLLCRGLVIGAVGKNGTILMRLPYSSMLYSISTGRATYAR